MGHYLIMGQTMSGKTTLAKIMAKGLKKKGAKVAVLDDILDPDWESYCGADFVTDNADEFLAFSKKQRNHFLLIDEGGSSIGKYNRPMDWLTTKSRHWGHSTIVISQRYQQLSKTLRSQTIKLYLFMVMPSDAVEVAKEWRSNPADILQKGEYLEIPRFGDIRKFRIDLAKRRIYTAEQSLHSKE